MVPVGVCLWGRQKNFEKKVRKNLWIQKKVVPLQSRSETSGFLIKSSLKRLKGKYKQVPRNCNTIYQYERQFL